MAKSRLGSNPSRGTSFGGPMYTIVGNLPNGDDVNIDVEVEDDGSISIVEFAVRVRPGEGDRGPKKNWADIKNLLGGDYYIV